MKLISSSLFMNKNALKKKHYFFMMLRDMELKSSKRINGLRAPVESNKFKCISINFDGFSIVFVGVHQNSNILALQFCSRRKQQDLSD